MANVAAADFVGGADADGAAGAGFGAEVALLLHDDYDAVACEEMCVRRGWRTGGWEARDIPTLAARFILRTLMHSATAAPELSMTLSMVLEGMGQFLGGGLVVGGSRRSKYLELDHGGGLGVVGDNCCRSCLTTATLLWYGLLGEGQFADGWMRFSARETGLP